MDSRPRCAWTGNDPLMVAYHDHEWGTPVFDDKELWAKLVLDGAQAGLSWATILKRKEGYLAAFHGLDPERVARYGEADEARLLADPGIIRNRAKVRSAIANAKAWLRLQEDEGSFSRYLWAFVDGRPLVNHWAHRDQVPAETELSRAVSRDLRQRGFSFVGPTIIYAYLQAVGLVNDHLVSCYRHREVQELAAAGPAPESEIGG